MADEHVEGDQEVQSDPRKDYLRDSIAELERVIADLEATNRATIAERDKYAVKAEAQAAQIENKRIDLEQKQSELGE